VLASVLVLRGPIELTIGLTAATGTRGPLEIAAWLFVPEQLDRECTPLLTCLHGGGYDKRYYHLVVPEHGDYSMASYLAARGCAVLAIDCLTIGASSRLPADVDAPEDLFAAAHDAAVRDVATRLREGTIDPELGPCDRVERVGIGHSLGGSLVTIQQAICGSFDRVAVLGTSAFAREWGAEFALTPEADGLSFDRVRLRSHFYWDDVPAAVIEADEAAGVPMSTHAVAWASSAIDHAREIDVPVFIGLGERDVSEQPHREPAAYPCSNDVTLFVLPRSGHCHNFAGTRQRLWDRVLAWVRS
jgi:pimeloyl-ACP methyl ester carboxylesterase